MFEVFRTMIAVVNIDDLLIWDRGTIRVEWEIKEFPWNHWAIQLTIQMNQSVECLAQGIIHTNTTNECKVKFGQSKEIGTQTLLISYKLEPGK